MGLLTHSFVFVYFKYVLVILEFCWNRFCVVLHVLIPYDFEVVHEASSSEVGYQLRDYGYGFDFEAILSTDSHQ